MTAGNGHLRFGIIGAGMSGILSAIKLRDAGYTDLAIYEKASDLGGTWRDNTYPGLSCDVPSHLYRYSFEANPDWSRRFSPGAEIWRYFDGVADKYGVRDLIRFNTEIVSADFRDNRWHIAAADGHTDVVDVLICATGVLHHPKYPEIDGLDSFDGACFHSARWNHAAPLDQSRVGVIGTGSTAVQITTAIVDRVARLDLFQRTPQWIMPVPNPEIPEAQKQHFRAHPEQMEPLYHDLAHRFQDSFSRAVVGDEEEMARIEQQVRENLEQNVHDPVLREKLRPDYRAACKRLIMSDGFYPAIQHPRANLVTEGISHVEPKGVRTKDGTLHALDTLVLATGFHAHDFMRPMVVTGRDGITLNKAWEGANEAHRAVAVPGFPNLFLLVGPNSPIGNFSLIMIAEMQLDYIMQLVAQVRAGRGRAVAPRAEACTAFNAQVREAMKKTVWVSGCSSWYLDKNGNPAMWPWTFEKFQADMAAPDLDEFEFAA